jgi:hypothetical protein
MKLGVVKLLEELRSRLNYDLFRSDINRTLSYELTDYFFSEVAHYKQVYCHYNPIKL